MILRRASTGFHKQCLSRVFSSTASASATTPGALDGIRVLDLSRVLAGPYCSMLLGDLGADVIKVERPGLGDELRGWGPPFMEPKKDVPGAKKESTYFLAINRNKRSMTANLKHRDGLEIVKRLAKDSDVFLENYIPGKMSELGLGYEELSKINPRLIYCSFSGYGPVGPYSQRPGYDTIVQAMGGMIAITGETDMSRPPVKVGIPSTDLSTGLYGYGAVMAALLARHRTGRGQKIDTNLLSSQLSLMVHVGSAYLNHEQEAKRLGTMHPNVCPYQGFPTKDGDLIVAAGNNGQFKKLCEKMELLELLDDPRFADNGKRVSHREELTEILNERFRTKTTAEWETLFDNSGLPFGPINNMEGTFNHEHVLATGQLQSVEHSSVGNVRVVGPAVTYSDTPASIRRAPPILGEHTDEVLAKELGFKSAEIERLRDEGAI